MRRAAFALASVRFSRRLAAAQIVPPLNSKPEADAKADTIFRRRATCRFPARSS